MARHMDPAPIAAPREPASTVLAGRCPINRTIHANEPNVEGGPRPGCSEVASRLTCRVIIVYLLLAAPVVAAALFWGSWGLVAIAAAVALGEYVALQRSQRFSARVWRSIGVGRRSGRERTTESVYVVAAVAGVALLVVAVLTSF